MNKEELIKQLEELKAKLKEEKKREWDEKRKKYMKENFTNKTIYIPKVIENKQDRDYYAFLKVAKQIGVKTFKKANDNKLYFVDDELKRFKELVKAKASQENKQE